jgi:hypothetical protein
MEKGVRRKTRIKSIREILSGEKMDENLTYPEDNT